MPSADDKPEANQPILRLLLHVGLLPGAETAARAKRARARLAPRWAGAPCPPCFRCFCPPGWRRSSCPTTPRPCRGAGAPARASGGAAVSQRRPRPSGSCRGPWQRAATRCRLGRGSRCPRSAAAAAPRPPLPVCDCPRLTFRLQAPRRSRRRRKVFRKEK